MALDAAQLKDDIVTALEADPNFSNDLATTAPAQIAYLGIVTQKIVDHIVSNLELKGIKVSDPSSTVETYVAGAGSSGGSLTGQIPIVGSVKKLAETHSQSNDGTGLVA